MIIYRRGIRMGRKVFVSYKYSDGRDCKDRIMLKLNNQGNVYKGEKGFNDLSSYASSTIKSYLSDMIYDSSVLLVVISPKVSQSDWVDWEIGYALRNTSRDGRASKRNGIVCVIQKDYYTGSSSWAYDYKGDVYETYLPRRIVQNMQETYGALSIFERPNRDYCVIVTESTFMSDPQKYIERAYERSCYPYIYPTVIK